MTAVAGLLTRRRAQELLRRSQRIAATLDGGSPDEETVRAICELLAQEGDLVGDLMEAIITRSFRARPSLVGGEAACGQERRPPAATRPASQPLVMRESMGGDTADTAA